MKTNTFRLLATMITLAAVITATNSLNAQRRSTGSSANQEQPEEVKNERRETAKEKSTSRDNAYERKAAERTVKKSNDVKRSSSSQNNEPDRGSRNYVVKPEQSRQSERNSFERNERENRNQAKPETNRNENATRNSNDWSRGTVEKERKPDGTNERINRGNYEPDRDERSGRISGATNRERYHLDDNDYRYKTNENYRGENKYWSSEIRNHNHGNGKKYDNRYHNHWNNGWEYYRWNHNSWRNYYSYYDPYSYRHHKFYYHHPYYGHVIKRFVYTPAVFIHNHNRYCCYDGHFFRYTPGIGYILVDIPFGMHFEYIPGDYEMVRINGFLYFRVGNLFFEYTRTGYELVHYPERYFAYDDNYYSGGFHFEITVN